MTFDPFGDFDRRGYLRNVARTKDRKIVRQMEHSSFTTGLDEAFAKLAARKRLSYDDILATHKILFEAVYPWAGEDRLTNAPRLVVSKGNDKKKLWFAYPQDIRRVIDYALHLGQEKAFMTAKPGEVMGQLAYGHPFLDGNGCTIMVVHCILAQRAGFSIDWASTIISPRSAERLKRRAMGIWTPILSRSSKAEFQTAVWPPTFRLHPALTAKAKMSCSVTPKIQS